MVISNAIRLWLLLIPLIPSVIVTIFDLYHLLINPALRTTLNNHVIILLLCCVLIEELTDGVWHIHYYRTNTVLSSTPAFCLVWVFSTSVGYISTYILMAWGSIERHIVYFHPEWLATKTKRFFFHYLPLIVCILWPVIFYSVMFFILPCDIPFNYNERLCDRSGCIILVPWVAVWDSFLHFMLPTFITVIFSVGLRVRVLYHKHRICHRIEWINYRKIVVLFLPISVLYLSLQLPPIILYAAYSAGLSRSVSVSYYSDSLFFSYWVILFIPFWSTLSVPELRTKYKNMYVLWRNRRDIWPEVFVMSTRDIVQRAPVESVVL